MSVDLDIARPAVPARPRRFAFGMSARLLLLTAGFVMLAELLVFAPSATEFRRGWLEERLQAARLAALAVEAAPDRLVNNEALAAELLSGAGVAAVAVKRDGVRELVLNATPPGAAAEFIVDMRTETWGQAFAHTARAFFPAPDSYLLIVGDPRAPDALAVEALVPRAPLADALRAHSAGFFAVSLVLSLVVGALVYVTLNLVLVRPIRRLTESIARFEAAPERAAPPPAPRRDDELGQAQTALAAMQRGLSQTLRQKQRLAALGEAVTRISHDLRNALSTASLISDRLAAEDDPRVRDLGARILRSVNRAAGMCEATLSYGGAGEADAAPRDLPLAAALDDAARECRGDNVQWSNLIDPALMARCDPEHLHRIALNLFRNAEAAMRGRDIMRLSVDAMPAGECVRIRIADTGPGLSEKARARLFQPFASGGGRQSTGLGLAIARDLARANGGELRLAHTGPDGAVFELELPSV